MNEESISDETPVGLPAAPQKPRKQVPLATVERVKEVFTYDPLTGIVMRVRAEASNLPVAPYRTGMRRQDGRVVLTLDYRRYYAYRIAFVLMTGEWPSGVVDHADGDPSNDRWSNLRSVSQARNCENRRRASIHNKTSDLLGCAYMPSRRKWRARIMANKQAIHLGLFDTKEAAHAAYVEAKRLFHKGNTL